MSLFIVSMFFISIQLVVNRRFAMSDQLLVESQKVLRVLDICEEKNKVCIDMFIDFVGWGIDGHHEYVMSFI